MVGGGDAAVQTTQNHPNRHSSLTLALSCMATTSPLFSEAAKLAADIRFLMILAAGRCGRTRRGTPHRVGRLDQHETASCVGRVVWRNPINRIRSYSMFKMLPASTKRNKGLFTTCWSTERGSAVMPALSWRILRALVEALDRAIRH